MRNIFAKCIAPLRGDMVFRDNIGYFLAKVDETALLCSVSLALFNYPVIFYTGQLFPEVISTLILLFAETIKYYLCNITSF